MDRVSSILPNVLKKRGMYHEAIAGLLLKRARSWIHEHLPEHGTSLTASKIEQGRLVILAKDSIALMAVRQRKDDLLVFLRKEIPEDTVSDIRILRS